MQSMFSKRFNTNKKSYASNLHILMVFEFFDRDSLNSWEIQLQNLVWRIQIDNQPHFLRLPLKIIWWKLTKTPLTAMDRSSGQKYVVKVELLSSVVTCTIIPWQVLIIRVLTTGMCMLQNINNRLSFHHGHAIIYNLSFLPTERGTS